MKNILLLCCTAGILPAKAQNDDLISKLKAANQNPAIEYDYKIILHDRGSKKILDSTEGHLVVKDGRYLDSNRYAFTARTGDYFCKLDFVKKTATVFNMKALAKKMRVKLENNQHKFATGITDSLLSGSGNVSIDSSDALFYRIKVRFKDQILSYAQMDFFRSGHKLAAAYFETVNKDARDPQYRRVTSLDIRRLNYTIDERAFDLKRMFTLSNGKTVLSRKYANYQLIPIEN